MKDKLITLLIAIVLVVAVRLYVFKPWLIKSHSMQPTLYENDLIISLQYPLLKLLPWSNNLSFRNKIIVFKNSTKEGEYLIKRIQNDKAPFYVLGDNQENSLDSRHFGNIPAKDVNAIACFVFYPFNHFKMLF